MSTVECVVDASAMLGECPLWSEHEQLLYWIDIDGKKIHRFDPATGADEVCNIDGRPGSIALTGSPGRLLLATEHELAWFDWEAGTVDPWVDLEEAGTGNRLNDGRCDPAGRFWVGSMFERAAEGRFTGRLHRVEVDGSSTTTRNEIGVANGLAFSPDGQTMYFADTLHDSIWAYDYDIDTGRATNERLFVDFTDLPGRPDGACVDSDGGYWVACVYGWALMRFTPDGAVDRTIELPVHKPTMPAFGGPDLDVIFLTSIGDGGSFRFAEDQEQAGGLFAIDPGAQGLLEPLFGGQAPS